MNGFSNIEDVKTVSVVVDSDNTIALYTLMGKLHTSKSLGKYVDIKRINDYIASPQPNKYSSLLTTLDLPDGKLEIEFTNTAKKAFNDLGIVSLIRNGQKNLDEYKRNIVFDEEQTVWFLPLNASYLDYIYHIGMGPHTRGVVVNGKRQNLKQKIKNGSIVKIIFSPKQVNQVDFTDSLPVTKEKIDTQNNLKNRDKLILLGRKMVEEVLKPRGLVNLNDVTIARNSVIHTLLLEDTNELCFKLATGDIHLSKISEILDRNKITKKNLGLSTLRVSGKNIPGTLNLITNLISKLGGNIYHITSPRPLERKNDHFSLRILLKGINQANAQKIKTTLSKNPKFYKVEIY